MESRTNTLTDAVLMQRVQCGQGDALGVLFDRHRRLVFNIAKRVLRDNAEAEDVTQEVFLEIYRSARRYDSSRGSVKIWILQYAYHRSFNRRKYLTLRGAYDSILDGGVGDMEDRGQPHVDDAMSVREWRNMLKTGLNHLSGKQRRLIELVVIQGLTIREASEQTKESYMNARHHYYRGLKKLRDFVRAGDPARAAVSV